MNAAEEFVGDFLTHFGVKGMKWGVRTRRPSARSVTTTVKPRRFAKTKVKVKGGRAHPAVPEAIKAREQQRILKKSGVNALSNKDLQELQTRLNLEQNVSRLAKTRTNKAGKEWIEKELKKTGSARLEARRVARTAAKAAAVAA